MSLKKIFGKKIFGKLETIAFLGILGLISRAIAYDYGSNREYESKIGKDYVIFLHYPDTNSPYDDAENIIDIIKPNDTVVSLRDSRGNDLKIEEVVIYPYGEKSRHYFSDEKLDRTVIRKGQKNSQSYIKGEFKDFEIISKYLLTKL